MTPPAAEAEELGPAPGGDALPEAERRSARREALVLAGRLLLGGVFLGSALVKAGALDAPGVGAAGAARWLAVAVELVGGGLLGLGLHTRRAALVLLVWLGVGLLSLRPDLRAETERVFALANVSLCGALCGVLAHGGGLLSLDRWRQRRRASTRAANRLNDAAT